MKLVSREYEFEGTPEELAQSGLVAVLRGRSLEAPEEGGPGSSASDMPDSPARFSTAIQTFLDVRVPSESRPTVEAIVEAVTGWPDVKAAIGPGVEGGRYIRFHRRGSPYGAFVYIHPTKAHLRLEADAAAGRSNAFARPVAMTNPHKIVVPLDDPNVTNEAIELIRQAYDDAS